MWDCRRVCDIGEKDHAVHGFLSAQSHLKGNRAMWRVWEATSPKERAYKWTKGCYRHTLATRGFSSAVTCLWSHRQNGYATGKQGRGKLVTDVPWLLLWGLKRGRTWHFAAGTCVGSVAFRVHVLQRGCKIFCWNHHAHTCWHWSIYLHHTEDHVNVRMYVCVCVCVCVFRCMQLIHLKKNSTHTHTHTHTYISATWCCIHICNMHIV